MSNALFVSTAIILSVSACGREEKDSKEYKLTSEQLAEVKKSAPKTDIAQSPPSQIQIGNGTPFEIPAYTQADLEFIAAIKEGNVRRVKSTLEAGTANIYSSDENGMSGLIIASSLKNGEVVQAILDRVAKNDTKALDRTDRSAEVAIIHAVKTGTPQIIAMLREKGANPNIYNVEQSFALLIAVKNNDTESVKALIKKYDSVQPTNINLQSGSGETAVLAATRNNNGEMIKLLVENGASLNSFDVDGITPLIYSVSKNDKIMFDFLLSLGADINYLGIGKKTPLLYAIENKNYEFAKYILDKGANPNIHVKDLASPLQLAVSFDNADPGIVDYLLAKGANLTDPEIPLGNVISRAIHKGNAPVIAKLIAKGAKVSVLEDKNNNGLLEALNVGDPDIAILMLDNGAEMNKTDAAGYTPLALAAKKKYKIVFDTLAKRNVDVNQASTNPKLSPLEIVMENDDGEMLETMFTYGLKANPDSLLLRAVNNKSQNIIPVLIKHGAKSSSTNIVGEPVIWTAIAKDDSTSAKALIDSGAPINAQDATKGITALSLAINKSNFEIAQYLLEKGADPNIADNNGFTSLTYAAANGQADMVKLIIVHKGDPKVTDKNGMSIPALVDVSKLPQEKKDEIKKILVTSPTPSAPVTAPAKP